MPFPALNPIKHLLVLVCTLSLCVWMGCAPSDDAQQAQAEVSPTVEDTLQADALGCEAPNSVCAGACVNLFTDPANCGLCGSQCERYEACDQGQCVLVCPDIQLSCGAVCATPASDPLHCGGCDQRCDAEEVCAQGQCETECPATLTRCGQACADTRTDPMHCGACSQACALPQATAVCVSAQCEVWRCHRGFEDCNADPSDGCEVFIDGDASHCGGCNTPCAPSEVCSQGQCTSTCAGNDFVLCGQSCRDLTQDAANCGTCGRKCLSNELCNNGSCQPTPSSKTPGEQRFFGNSAFRYIPAGSFTMGSPTAEPTRISDETQHEVTLTQGFWLKETEVTQAEWEAVMNDNPSNFLSCGNNCPVEKINWWDAVQFCNALSSQQGLTPCYTLSDCTNTPGSACSDVIHNADCAGYRLPTEAEWEFAARAGTTTAFYNGDLTQTFDCDLDPNLDAIGWYCGNAGGTTHPVGGKEPNAWGLRDMLGNVREWCWDWYTFYATEPQRDPMGPPAGSSGRINRGGSWFNYGRDCRVAIRHAGSDPSERQSYIGLRVVKQD